jgi:hypothetical protein
MPEGTMMRYTKTPEKRENERIDNDYERERRQHNICDSFFSLPMTQYYMDEQIFV